MRQKRTVRASSVCARRGVWLAWAIFFSLVRGDYDGPLSISHPIHATHISLPLQVGFQRFHSRARQVDGTAAPLGLRLSEGDSPSAAHDRAPYVDDSFVQVDILPLQSQKLALPHAGVHGQDIGRFQLVAACRLDEIACLIW